MQALEVALPVLEQQETKKTFGLRENVEKLRAFIAGNSGYNYEAFMVGRVATFFMVEHAQGYEVEATLQGAIQKQADFGGVIWELTGNIRKPRTDTYQ